MKIDDPGKEFYELVALMHAWGDQGRDLTFQMFMLLGVSVRGLKSLNSSDGALELLLEKVKELWGKTHEEMLARGDAAS